MIVSGWESGTGTARKFAQCLSPNTPWLMVVIHDTPNSLAFLLYHCGDAWGREGRFHSPPYRFLTHRLHWHYESKCLQAILTCVNQLALDGDIRSVDDFISQRDLVVLVFHNIFLSEGRKLAYNISARKYLWVRYGGFPRIAPYFVGNQVTAICPVSCSSLGLLTSRQR